jgi:hypothetical protein
MTSAQRVRVIHCVIDGCTASVSHSMGASEEQVNQKMRELGWIATVGRAGEQWDWRWTCPKHRRDRVPL